MHQQSRRQLQERLTAATMAEVLIAAEQFFSRGSGIYSAFVERVGPTHIALRGQGGEELVIGVWDTPEGTRVSGSSYLFDQQIARFLDGLPPAPPPPAPALLPDPASAESAPVDAASAP